MASKTPSNPPSGDLEKRLAEILETMVEDGTFYGEIGPEIEGATEQAIKALKALLASQVAAEYKQLLASLPSPAKPKTDADKGWNGALEACRAIIEARIKGLTDD